MRFSKGVLGLVVVISAIMVTVLLGFAMHTTDSIAEEQRFERVTDVTHLFPHENIDEYIDYNPTENWTGFRTYGEAPTSGILFDTLPSGQSNLYPIVHEETGTATTATLPDDTTLNYGPITDPNRRTDFILTDDDVSNNANVAWNGYGGWASSNPTQQAIYSWIQTMDRVVGKLGIGSTIEYMDIDTSDSGIMINRISDWNLAGWQGGQPGYRTNVYYARLADVQDIDRVRVSLTTGIVTAYHGDDLLWISSTSDTIAMVGGYRYVNGEISGSAVPSTVAYTEIVGSTVEYMDISKGVRVDSLAFWNNNHNNSQISVLVHNPTRLTGSQSVMLRMQLTGSHYTELDYFDTIRVTFNATSAGVATNADSVRFGTFDTLLVTLDAAEGIVRVNPVRFTSFLDYEVLDAGAEIGMAVGGNAGWIQWIRFDNQIAAPQPARFGIVDTHVHMNTYNAVISDSSIRISEWFPQYTLYKLQFNSFGLVGGSVLIGTQTYDVRDGKIWVEDAETGRETGYDLNLLTLIYQKTGGTWTVSLETPKGPLVLQTGAPDAVGFYDGYWLFSSGLYRGETVAVTHHDIDLSGWAFDDDLAIVVYMGMLVLGTALGTKIQTVGLMDLVVVGCGGLFGWVLMGA